MITKNKNKTIKRQMQIKIFNLINRDIYPIVLGNFFIKIIFLFKQTII